MVALWRAPCLFARAYMGVCAYESVWLCACLQRALVVSLGPSVSYVEVRGGNGELSFRNQTPIFLLDVWMCGRVALCYGLGVKRPWRGGQGAQCPVASTPARR